MLFRLFLLCLILALPAEPTRAQTAPGGSAAALAAATDMAIQNQVRAFLIELDGYDDVRVAVSSGIVTLTGEVVEASALERLLQLVDGVEGVIAIENEVTESTDLSKRLNPVAERLKTRAHQWIAAAPLVLVALVAGGLVALVGFVLARNERPWNRLAPNSFIADIYRKLLRLAFSVLGVVVALEVLDATALLSTILGAAGIIGLALGFAVRDMVENFLASIMMSIRQPFSPNDVVEINGDMGKVIRLTSRATILLSFDGNHIRLPNATVYGSRIVNYSRNAERRFSFRIAVNADGDLARARTVMEETVAALPYTLEMPGVSVWIEDLTNAGIEFTVTGWIDQTETSIVRARGEALRLVKAALEDAGFAIPDTTYRIVLDGAGAPSGSEPVPRPPRGPDPRSENAAQLPEIVNSRDNEALDHFIDAERADDHAPDLLNQSAPKE